MREEAVAEGTASAGQGRGSPAGETASVDATNRWAGVEAVPWAATGLGLVTREPAILLLAAVGVAFVAYSKLGTPPDPTIRVTRTVDDATPAPGQSITVRLTVENDGDRTLPDLRLVDGVPSTLGVVERSPHLGTALRSGESLTHTYTLRAERGTHSFDPVTVVCRSLDGAHQVETTVAAETTVVCNPAMRSTAIPPLRGVVSHHGGQVPTNSGGHGVEFYGIREYRPGDGVNRIDWTRRARTGELTTLEYREERMATVVLAVDARDEAYVRTRRDVDETHAVEWSVRAAADAFTGLADAGNRVGIAAIGSSVAWLDPGVGDAHRSRARDLLAGHPALSPSPHREHADGLTLRASTPDLSRETELQLRHLEARLPADGQVFFLSPLADEPAVTVARRFAIDGNAVTVVSPDVTVGETVGNRLARLERRRRIRALNRAGVRVVDWRPPEPLAVAFDRAREAWR